MSDKIFKAEVSRKHINCDVAVDQLAHVHVYLFTTVLCCVVLAADTTHWTTD